MRWMTWRALAGRPALEESVRLRVERRGGQQRRADEITNELAAHAVSDAAVEDLKVDPRRYCPPCYPHAF